MKVQCFLRKQDKILRNLLEIFRKFLNKCFFGASKKGCTEWRHIGPNIFHLFSWQDIANWISKRKIKREMRWYTGSQMHAIQDPAASTDMTKQGRKYGNLKIRPNLKVYLDWKPQKTYNSNSMMIKHLPPKYGLFREKIGVLFCWLIKHRG